MEESPELSTFVLRNFQLPDHTKMLGVGSYGSVEEIDVGGLTCAGKTLHKELIDTANKGVEVITERFVKECQLMSQLRHPHIVQFLGICFRSQSQLPILVMEYLPTNLDTILEKYSSIPIPIKRSILHDVSLGLTYLHSHSPTIIHRDLTARNVLLTSAMVAKIADFGNSRIVDISPDQLAKTMTCVPGTLVYLPPEAFDPQPKYNEKLDIFSFGHLLLYTMVQEFPLPTGSTFMNPDTKVIIARSEVERRGHYIDKLDLQFSQFKQLLVECLDNDPDKRPTAQHLSQTLKNLEDQFPNPYTHLFRFDLIQQPFEESGTQLLKEGDQTVRMQDHSDQEFKV